MSVARERAVTLKNLRDGIHLSISELEKQRNREQVVTKAFLVLRFTKASCDAFISMAASMAGAAKSLGGKKFDKMADGAGIVEKLYGVASSAAENIGTAAAGGKTNWTKTVTEAVKAGGSHAVGKATGLSEAEKQGYELLINSAAVKVNVINHAMNEDKKDLVKTASSYAYDLHTSIGDIAAEHMKGKGAAATKSLATFAKIAKAVFDYNEELGDAATEMADAYAENEQRYASLKRMFIGQARSIAQKIDELNKYVSSCEAELAPKRLP